MRIMKHINLKTICLIVLCSNITLNAMEQNSSTDYVLVKKEDTFGNPTLRAPITQEHDHKNGGPEEKQVQPQRAPHKFWKGVQNDCWELWAILKDLAHEMVQENDGPHSH